MSFFRESPQDAFFRVLEASLEETPEDWSADAFRITNATMRTSIWIANSTYGIHAEVRGARVDANWRWRRRLRRAVNRCLAKQAISALKLREIERVGTRSSTDA